MFLLLEADFRHVNFEVAVDSREVLEQDREAAYDPPDLVWWPPENWAHISSRPSLILQKPTVLQVLNAAPEDFGT